MRHDSHLYDQEDTQLYQTNLYSGTNADIANVELFAGDIDLTIMLGAAIDFRFTASGAVDDLELALYKRRDNDWDDDEIAVWSVTIASDGTEDIYHFTIDPTYGAGHYRFGMASSGGTDTFDMDAQMRRWRNTREIG